MNDELQKIAEWFNVNKLSLNSDKTNYPVHFISLLKEENN